MKTQIITLESHDDLISVRDRMSWAKTPRILLVAPKFEVITLRYVDLKILQRHASSLGAQLGIVTRTRRLREDAETLGIPLFESTGQAQRIAWASAPRRRMPRRAPAKNLREKREQVQVKEEAWRSSPILRVAALSVGVFSVLAIVALFLPRAHIKLTPISETQSVALTVVASPSVESVFVTGSIPAREKRIIVDGTQTVIVTGEGVIPQSKARGIVEFRNLTQDAATIPAGTIVRANEIRFVTMQDAVLDAGVGKKIETAIEAVEGGLAGNVDAETINAIDGRLGLSLSVTNLEPTRGGRELASVQASDEDRARAKDLLTEFLAGEAREKYLNESNPGDMLFENTIAVSQILSEEYDPPAGSAGTTLTLTMQVEYAARYASASDVAELASLALNASLPPGFFPASGRVSVESITQPTVDASGSTRWRIRAQRLVFQRVDSAQVVSLIQGQHVKTAQSLLNENLPLESSPEINLSPSWWQWIPILPFRIEVATE